MKALIERLSKDIPELSGANCQSVSGGCINQSYQLIGREKSFFLKVNAASKCDMFEAERDGLNEMKAAKGMVVPEPYLVGTFESKSYLLMEFFDIQSYGDGAKMGRALAEMHRIQAEQHGWHRDNTIGATLQVNQREVDWLVFLKEYRLGFQMDLARSKGLNLSRGDELLNQLDRFFEELPAPSLLHGDLWSGNAGFTGKGAPILFDPATHYGDRECDLAMTEMFGGFSSDFYQAYHEAYPIDSGYEKRRDLYQLYHVLNHYNLFGGGYGQQSESLIAKLIIN